MGRGADFNAAVWWGSDSRSKRFKQQRENIVCEQSKNVPGKCEALD